MAGAALLHQLGAGGGGQRALGHVLRQVAEHLLVDHLKQVHAGERGVGTLLQVVFDGEIGGEAGRERVKGGLVADVVLPALEKDEGIGVEWRRLAQGQLVAAAKELERKVGGRRGGGHVAKGAAGALPEQGVEPAAGDQRHLVGLAGGQFA